MIVVIDIQSDLNQQLLYGRPSLTLACSIFKNVLRFKTKHTKTQLRIEFYDI
jgi:hypothetical protein